MGGLIKFFHPLRGLIKFPLITGWVRIRRDWLELGMKLLNLTDSGD